MPVIFIKLPSPKKNVVASSFSSAGKKYRCPLGLLFAKIYARKCTFHIKVEFNIRRLNLDDSGASLFRTRNFSHWKKPPLRLIPPPFLLSAHGALSLYDKERERFCGWLNVIESLQSAGSSYARLYLGLFPLFASARLSLSLFSLCSPLFQLFAALARERLVFFFSCPTGYLFLRREQASEQRHKGAAALFFIIDQSAIMLKGRQEAWSELLSFCEKNAPWRTMSDKKFIARRCNCAWNEATSCLCAFFVVCGWWRLRGYRAIRWDRKQACASTAKHI